MLLSSLLSEPTKSFAASCFVSLDSFGSIESLLTNDFNVSGSMDRSGFLEGNSSTMYFNLVASGDDTNSGCPSLEVLGCDYVAAMSNFLPLDTESSL